MLSYVRFECWYVCVLSTCCVFFFFKQKTAYEMRISDWSSDVCSSDLLFAAIAGVLVFSEYPTIHTWIGAALIIGSTLYTLRRNARRQATEIGRASCRERVCQYV